MPLLLDTTQLTFFEQFPESPQSYHSTASSTPSESSPLDGKHMESKEHSGYYRALTENLTEDKLSHSFVSGANRSSSESPGLTANVNEQPPVRSSPKSLLQRALTKCTVPTSFFPRRTLSSRNPRPSLHVETIMSGAQRAANAGIAQSAPVKGSRRRGSSLLGKTPESVVKAQCDQAVAEFCSSCTACTDKISTVRTRSTSAARPWA